MLMENSLVEEVERILLKERYSSFQSFLVILAFYNGHLKLHSETFISVVTLLSSIQKVQNALENANTKEFVKMANVFVELVSKVNFVSSHQKSFLQVFPSGPSCFSSFFSS